MLVELYYTANQIIPKTDDVIDDELDIELKMDGFSNLIDRSKPLTLYSSFTQSHRLSKHI